MNHAPPRVERDLGAFLAWFLEMDIDRFDLAVQRRHGPRALFLAPSYTGHWYLDHLRLRRLLPWLRAENVHGADIYFRPHAKTPWPVVFLDDLPTPFAARVAHKYRANVIETSLGRTHVWLATTKPLDPTQRTQAQRFLVTKLRGLADRGSISGDHWGRLPGMRNRKPGRNGWVNLHTQSRRRPWTPSLLETTPLPSGDPRAKERSRHDDASRSEWGWVMGCLENGIPSQVVLARLIERASPRRGHDTERYARRTLARACRRLGIHPP